MLDRVGAICVFFFVKQKTAYEMRISDWSSDVCSSDLNGPEVSRLGGRRTEGRRRRQGRARRDRRHDDDLDDRFPRDRCRARPRRPCPEARPEAARTLQPNRRLPGRRRSEEHTSELQSLMRISYAVFCLKKKKQKQTHRSIHTNHNNETTTK